jgi:hypothetical protein
MEEAKLDREDIAEAMDTLCDSIQHCIFDEDVAKKAVAFAEACYVRSVP